MKTYNKRI